MGVGEFHVEPALLSNLLFALSATTPTNWVNDTTVLEPEYLDVESVPAYLDYPNQVTELPLIDITPPTDIHNQSDVSVPLLENLLLELLSLFNYTTGNTTWRVENTSTAASTYSTWPLDIPKIPQSSTKSDLDSWARRAVDWYQVFHRSSAGWLELVAVVGLLSSFVLGELWVVFFVFVSE